jgi:hypothetical protein
MPHWSFAELIGAVLQKFPKQSMKDSNIVRTTTLLTLVVAFSPIMSASTQADSGTDYLNLLYR